VSARELPAGTVTLLFTDVEGSTRLLQEDGPRYADLLGEHRRALRDAFTRHSGVEVDTQGDAFFVAFRRAAHAVAAAAEARVEGAPTLIPLKRRNVVRRGHDVAIPKATRVRIRLRS